MKDLTGKKFGRLTAIKPTDERKNRSVVWLCRCECGNTALASSRNLTVGITTSCGCGRKKRPVKEGERFGALVAVERIETNGKGPTMWRCKCDCGNECEAVGSALRAGHRTSCGCGTERGRRSAETKRSSAGARLSTPNGRLSKRNTSGVRGVSWDKRTRKWRAYISQQGKSRYLGYFGSLADAAEARREAERELLGPAPEARQHVAAPGREREGTPRKDARAGRSKDLTGMRFGRLTAIKPTEDRYHNSVVWLCRCECGNTALVPSRSLTNGNTKSCGCAKRGNAVKEGERFGSLVALERIRNEKGQPVWRCACDCGNECEVVAAALRAGYRTSCGCGMERRKRRAETIASKRPSGSNASGVRGVTWNARRQKWAAQVYCRGERRHLGEYAELGDAIKARRKAEEEKEPDEFAKTKRAKDLAGEKFGRLTAIKPTERRDSGSVMWLCRCDCGNEAIVSARNLANNHTTSCGCRKGNPVKEGERFGSLVAVERVGTDKRGQPIWRCACDCGGEVEAAGIKLRGGSITSCGCGATKNKRVKEANGTVDGTRLSMLNGKAPKSNTSGVRGVVLIKGNQKWRAQIKLRGKTRYLGEYDSLAEAAEARREAEKELFDPILEAHGRKPTSEREYEETLRKAVEARREKDEND